MSKCPVCSTELNFLNTPLLGKSKLANGEKLCKNCYDRLLTMCDQAQIQSLTPNDVAKLFADDDAYVDGIITQIENTGMNRQSIIDYWASTELKYLPGVLDQDETIVAFANGVYDDVTGVIVATQARLFFLAKQPLLDPEVTDFDWDLVESVTPEIDDEGVGVITIAYDGDLQEIFGVRVADANRFADNVAANIEGFGDDDDEEDEDEEDNAQPGMAEADVPAQLEKYAALKEKGVITQAEFDAKKKQLLGL